MAELVETRWTRYGKDRVYVNTPEGQSVGYVDLVSGSIAVTVPGLEAALQDALRRWTGRVNDPLPEMQAASFVGARRAPDGPRDLANNVAGAAARAKRDEVNAQAPIANLVARAFGMKTNERAWRVGARGEEKVAAQLAKLDARWHILHAVEVGTRGTDIDHVVIGPPGVVTLNTKRHPGSRAWVGAHRIMVNGQRTDYLRKSRWEARRASTLLSEAAGTEVPVVAAVVFVDLADFTVKEMPADVYVTTRRRVVAWLRSLSPRLDREVIDGLFDVARRSTTWNR